MENVMLFLVPVIATIAGAAGFGTKRSTSEEYSKTAWYDRGQEELKRALELEEKLIKTKAKNIILVVGDGMGISTVTATRWYKAERYGTPKENTRLVFEDLPHVAFSKTYNADGIVADSAGTASAMMSGEKAWEGVVGVNSKVPRGDCHAEAGNKVQTVLDYAMEQGKSTGIVTTTRITHATPSAAYAHSCERDWENDNEISDECKGISKDIALQLVEDNPNINVLFGGGRNHFLPNDTYDPEETNSTGLRTDGRNLIEEWKTHKLNKGLEKSQYKTAYGEEDFNNIDPLEVDYVLGLMQYSHIGYDYLRATDTFGQPSLAEMTRKAIQILQKNTEGYFLLIEGGHIDWAHHVNLAKLALEETLAMEEAVQVAMEMSNVNDTLLIVTADHSHVFTLAGYTQANTTGLLEYDSRMMSRDGKPYLAMGYTNGPGFVVHRMENGTEIPRRNITEFGDDIYKLLFVSDAAVDVDYETHGGEEVAIYARGPWSHLFHATHEQSYIGHVMMHAACLRASQAEHCSSDGSGTPNNDKCTTAGASTATLSLSTLVTLFTLSAIV